MIRTLLFSIIVLGVGFICRAIDGWEIDVLQPQIGQLIWLVSPLILALIFHYTSKEKADWGFRFQWKSSWQWYLISILLFPLLTLLLVAVGGQMGSIDSLKSLYTVAFLSAFLIAIPGQLIKNFFEEFVWRGYLFAALEQKGISGWKNDLFIGVVWALWHVPYLDGFTGIYHDLDWTLFFPLFLIGVVATAFVYGVIRRKSRTIWTAVLLHTTANAITNVLFFEKYIQLNAGKEWWVSPTIDNVGYIVLIGLAAILLTQIKFQK